MRVLHITQGRMDRIVAQGWLLPQHRTMREPRVGDTTYHLMKTEHGYCGDCKSEVDSVTPDTPADLERMKAKLALEEITQ